MSSDESLRVMGAEPRPPYRMVGMKVAPGTKGRCAGCRRQFFTQSGVVFRQTMKKWRATETFLFFQAAREKVQQIMPKLSTASRRRPKRVRRIIRKVGFVGKVSSRY